MPASSTGPPRRAPHERSAQRQIVRRAHRSSRRRRSHRQAPETSRGDILLVPRIPPIHRSSSTPRRDRRSRIEGVGVGLIEAAACESPCRFPASSRPEPATCARLEDCPRRSGGRRHLRAIGIARPEQLAGRDPYALYRRQPPHRVPTISCMLDTFHRGGALRRRRTPQCPGGLHRRAQATLAAHANAPAGRPRQGARSRWRRRKRRDRALPNSARCRRAGSPRPASRASRRCAGSAPSRLAARARTLAPASLTCSGRSKARSPAVLAGGRAHRADAALLELDDDRQAARHR